MAVPFIGILILSILPFIAIVAVFIFLIYEKYNIISGILLSALISFIGFIIYPDFFVFWYGDIYYTIGCLFGLVVTFKNVKPDQLIIRTAILVGICGPTLSSLFSSIFEWFIYTIINGYDIIVLGIYILYFTPFALILGIIIGYIYGYYRRKKEEPEDDLSLF